MIGLLGAVLAWALGSTGPTADPLTAPIAIDQAPLWTQPQAPLRIHGETYLVGFVGMNVVLIRSDAGLILIDGGLPQAVPAIEAHIRQLGLRVADIRLILSSEPHYDHAGGLAALSRDSGAPVLTSRAGAQVLRAGQSSADDPQRPVLFAFPPVDRLRVVRDGDRIRLGRVVITAHATPGHTPGSMSWSWRSCEAKRCVSIVFASSLNSRTEGAYRWSDTTHRTALARFRQTLATIRGLPCDIVLTGHPEHTGGAEKVAALQADPNSTGFRDPAGCRKLADRYQGALDDRLASEAVPHRG